MRGGSVWAVVCNIFIIFAPYNKRLKATSRLTGNTLLKLEVFLQRIGFFEARNRVVLLEREGINLDFRPAVAEVCDDVLGGHLRVGAGDVEVEIAAPHQVVQDVVEGDVEHLLILLRHLAFVDVGVFHLERQLYLVDEHIVALRHILGAAEDVVVQHVGIAVLLVGALVQRYLHEAVISHSFGLEVLLVEGRQEERFSAAANAGEDFYLAVPALVDEILYILVSIDNHCIVSFLLQI